MSKRLDRAYRSGRSRDWLKTKCVLSDTFVIIGYQPGSGAVRAPLANLKIARIDGQRLRYAGAVGTGFSERVAAALRERLDRIRAERCAVAGLKVSGAVWVSPELRAEIAYRGITTAGEYAAHKFQRPARLRSDRLRGYSRPAQPVDPLIDLGPRVANTHPLRPKRKSVNFFLHVTPTDENYGEPDCFQEELEHWGRRR